MRRKNLVITGGVSGIGRSVVKLFQQRGWNIFLLDNARPPFPETPAETQNIKFFLVDISDKANLEKIFSEIENQVDFIDAFIGNAGISIREKFLDVTEESFDRVIATNLKGTFFSTQIAAKHMVKRSVDGVIALTGSINGLGSFPNYAPYNSSKAGVINLGRNLARELPSHIRVLVISPGAVWTPMQEREYTMEMKKNVESMIPMGRHASAEEIAEYFFFLVSEKARFLHGTNVVIDGGELA